MPPSTRRGCAGAHGTIPAVTARDEVPSAPPDERWHVDPTWQRPMPVPPDPAPERLARWGGTTAWIVGIGVVAASVGGVVGGTMPVGIVVVAVLVSGWSIVGRAVTARRAARDGRGGGPGDA